MNGSGRLATLRNYFEVDCSCIASGRVKKAGESVSDIAAVDWYERICECSRNYVENGPRYSDDLDGDEVAEIFSAK